MAATSQPIAVQASPQSGFDTPRSWRSQSAVSTMSGQVGVGVRSYAHCFGARRTSSSVLSCMTVPASVRCGYEDSPSRGSLGRSGSPGWGTGLPAAALYLLDAITVFF
jgi:hypothetical protein